MRSDLVVVLWLAGAACGCGGHVSAGGGPGETPRAPEPVALTGTVPGADARGYVGGERCAGCHADVHATWAAGLHAKALRPASPATIHAPLAGPEAAVGEGDARFEVFERDGAIFMRCLGPDGRIGEYRVDYSIGDRRTHMLIHRLPDGRLQVLPGFVDIAGGYWFPYWEFFFDVGSKGPVRPDDVRFWSNPGRCFNAAVYSELCVNCHTTGPERRFDPVANTYDTRWVDMTVSCEACHGPGAAHVERREYLKRGLATPAQAAGWVPLTMLEGERVMETCAQCHASKQALRPGYTPGADWYDYYMPVLLDDATHVYPDGTFKELNYNWLAVQQSRCFTEGGAVCTTCHAAHGSPNRTDLRFAPGSDATCLQCHADLGDAAAARAHTHHDPAQAGGRCVECHMSPRTIENGHGRIRDHTMSVPRPRNTRVHGIPSACTTCHADRDPAWAEARMAEWWPRAAPDPHEAIADAIAGGRAGDPAAREGLLALLGDRSAHWVYRASAARLLAAYGDPETRAGLLAVWRRGDEHPVVRPSALFGLLGQAADGEVRAVVRAALDDRQTAARQYAAFGLVYGGDTARAGDCRRIIRAIVDFLPDNVDHRAALARACALDGDPEAAWGHWATCLRIFPLSRDMLTGASAFAAAQAEQAAQAKSGEMAARWQARAVAACDPYVERRPQDAFGRLARAKAREQAGEFAGALADVQAVLDAGVREEHRATMQAWRDRLAASARDR